MNEIIQFFSHTTFNWSIIESVAVFFSMLYAILVLKESIWCWGAAAVGSSLYIYICFSAQLYSQTSLQVFYLFMAFYGYYNWNKKDQYLEISEWSIGKHLLILAIGTTLIFLIGFYLSAYTNAKMPIVDSFTTVFSLFATYMVAKKILENWLYWIVIDAVLAYLYFSRDLHLTSLLFMTWTIIAVFGYFSWIKKMQRNA